MPLPAVLLPFAGTITAWVNRTLVVAGAAYLYDAFDIEKIKRDVFDWIIAYFSERAGITLDYDDPLSEASITSGISNRIGIPMRSLRDPVTLKEDLDSYVSGQLSARSGYQVNSVVNVDVLKNDLERIAMAVLTEKLGVPAGVLPGEGELLNPAAIKERLLSWAKAEIFTRLESEAGISVDEIMAMADVEGLAATMNRQLTDMESFERITAQRIAVRIANQMGSRAVADYQRVVMQDTKQSRRRRQVKEAQRRFREKHGNRWLYAPVDFFPERANLTAWFYAESEVGGPVG